MGHITVNITNIDLPATIELVPEIGTLYNVETLGMHTMEDIPEGQYTIVILDSNGCSWVSDLVCVVDETTTTTTTEIITTTTTTTVEDMGIIPSYRQLGINVGYCDNPSLYPLSNNIFTPDFIVKGYYEPNMSWEDLEYIEITSVSSDTGLTITYNGVDLAAGNIIYAGTAQYSFVLGNILITRVEEGAFSLFGEIKFKIKLFGYNISSEATAGIEHEACTPETTTTTTTDLGIDNVKYGALYNWWATTSANNISSSNDWIVPTIADYQTLADYLGASGDYETNVVGSKLKEAGTTYWTDPNNGATNETEFSGRGGGYRSGMIGIFNLIKDQGNYAVSNNISTNSSRVAILTATSEYFECDSASAYNKDEGISVRLLYTGVGAPTSYTGNDGKIYPVVQIGTQYWLASNLNETKYRNGSWITGFNSGVYTPISNATWAAKTTEAMCYYNDDESNG